MDEQPKEREFPRLRVLVRVILLGFSAVSLYLFAPQIFDVLQSADRLETVQPLWFVAMACAEAGSFVAAWQLARSAVPELSWFVAGTAQLASNAVTRVVPGGAAVGGALYFRMLSVSGMSNVGAAAALTATSLVSTMTLLAIPAVATVTAAIYAPVPEGLLPVAAGGTAIFLLLFAVIVVVVRFDRPMLAIGRLVEKVATWLADKRHRIARVTAEGLVHRRDEIVGALGERWRIALAAASANWLLDYLTLVGALFAVGSRPRLSLVLLAYAAAALLSMVPITPGGLGFVEAGLTATLTVAGVPVRDALLATLAYRLFAFWLPILAGAGAYVVFRRRYGRIPQAREIAE